jgi:hypothetical protein
VSIPQASAIRRSGEYFPPLRAKKLSIPEPQLSIPLGSLPQTLENTPAEKDDPIVRHTCAKRDHPGAGHQQ